MNRFFITSSAAVFSRTNSYNTFSSTTLLPSFWNKRIVHTGISTFTLRFRVQCFSSTTATTPVRRKRTKKTVEPEFSSTMEDDKDAFYVVRKGDIVGVYKTLSDCQAQVGSTVCDPAVSVYKGYSFPKEADEYLTSRGLKNAIYTINAADAKEDLFGSLVPCLFQQPSSSRDKPSNKPSPPKRSQEVLESTCNLEEIGSRFPTDGSLRKHLKLDKSVKAQPNYVNCVACTLEFDGACKGNPGLSGAGAVLRAADGSLVWRLREGVGIATNNVAEYRAILLGLKQALKKGFTEIRVKGDSKLVCMQVQGLWKCKNENMANLCKEVKELVAQFSLFEISHVLRDFNSDADAEANLALNLKDGEVEEICEDS